jgi:hypothetical protein
MLSTQVKEQVLSFVVSYYPIQGIHKSYAKRFSISLKTYVTISSRYPCLGIFLEEPCPMQIKTTFYQNS